MYGLADMLDIPQQNPLKYGFNGIETLLYHFNSSDQRELPVIYINLCPGRYHDISFNECSLYVYIIVKDAGFDLWVLDMIFML